MGSALIEYDRKLAGAYGRTLVGVDEVGRGPFAGPVFAAALSLPLEEEIEGVDDSKKLSPKTREALFERIVERADFVAVCSCDAAAVDELNILNATRRAMTACLKFLDETPLVLVDAVRLDIPQPTLHPVRGDGLSYHIAAASIAAKVLRDRFMTAQDALWPGYGFARNKGYGTAEHREAILRLGPCPLHRRTFLNNLLGPAEKPLFSRSEGREVKVEFLKLPRKTDAEPALGRQEADRERKDRELS